MLKDCKFYVEIIILLFSLLITGCGGLINANVNNPGLQPSLIPSETSTITATPFQAMTNTPMVLPPTYTPTATFTPSATFTPLPTDTPTPTETPPATATPEMEWHPSGDVIAPILLYHHVSDAGMGNRYYVSIDNFKAQMEALRDWGYTTITPSQLSDVLINGGELPNRPVVITFDDGNLDVYQYAFPIMREMGFVGAFYIVANRLQSSYYVTADQIMEMASAGWEIGNHGMSHSDLTLDYSTIYYEMVQSRIDLQAATGLDINTFAYAYGKTDEFVTGKVSEYGYRAAMGLGMSSEHTWGTLFYLARKEVQGGYSLSSFASLLPWSDQ